MGDSYTIQINPELIDRLVNKNEQTRKRTRKSKPNDAGSSLLPYSKNPQEHSENSDLHKAPVPSGGWSLQPPFFLPVTTPQPSLTYANELREIRSARQESEAILKKLENKDAEMALALAQKVKDFDEIKVKQRTEKCAPCSSERRACLDCYMKNRDEPLVCADVVKRFSDCSRKAWQDASGSVKK